MVSLTIVINFANCRTRALPNFVALAPATPNPCRRRRITQLIKIVNQVSEQLTITHTKLTQ